MALGRWLAVDPGETTGWSIWGGERLLGGGQTPMGEFIMDVWDDVHDDLGVMRGDQPWLLDDVDPADNEGPLELVVCEKFALYPQEARSGSLDWEEFRTVQLIGQLKLVVRLHGLVYVPQPATIKKPARAAGSSELFARPLHENRHQNDSIDHGFYYTQTQLRGIHIPVKDSAAEKEASR